MADAIHILYVDDEPVLLQIAKLFLEKDGEFSVETIESAPAALELLKDSHFDAVISDYQMPLMDGIQFLIEVRARFGKIPFILFTGRGREEIVIQAINHGADFYLQKGGNPDAQFAELSHQVLAIVAQRAAEKAFRESENRYRSLVENMHDCIAVYRALDDGGDFEILEFNHAAERTEKITRDEVIGSRVTEAFPGVREFGILDVFRRVWCTGIPESFPVSLYRDDRISGWRDNFVFKLPSGEIVASYSDETARKQAEEALKKSEEQYRSLIETTGTGYVILDNQGRVITANQEYLRLTGRSSDSDIKGRSVTEWTAPYDLERNAKEIERCLLTGRIRGLEIDYQKPDGTIQPIEINASVIRSGSEKVIMTLCWDISRRKQIELELERKNEELLSSYGQLTSSDDELK